MMMMSDLDEECHPKAREASKSASKKDAEMMR